MPPNSLRAAKAQQQQHKQHKQQSQGRESSPFSSPTSNLHPSPIAARRGSIEERRRPAANFEHPLSLGLASRINEEDQDEENVEEEDEEEEEIDEDAAGELSPLLPIFSAAHLGMSMLASQNCLCDLF